MHSRILVRLHTLADAAATAVGRRTSFFFPILPVVSR